MEVTDEHARKSPPAQRPHPLHGRPSFLLLALLGGAVGTTVRAWLEGAFPASPGAWPWTTFGINLGGSFLLGLLQEALSRSGPDEGWRRRVRVGVGTGVIGGFTTYSTFIVEVDLLVRGGSTWTGAAYAVVSVVVGLGCALAGILLAQVASTRVASTRRPTANPS